MRAPLLIAVLSIVGPAEAQSLLQIDGKEDFEPRDSRTETVAAFALDFDGDARTDILFGHEFRTWPMPALHRASGEGRFCALAPCTRAQLRARAVTDLDGDGYFEIIVDDDPLLRVLRDGAIVAVSQDLGDGPAQVGDVDGDGDLDVVRAGRSGLTLWLQTGSLAFAPSLGLQGPSGSAIRLGDVDRDGDLDLLVARDGAADGLYRNDGSGVFTDVSAMLPVGTDRSVDCLLQDLDGDGDTDVLFLNHAPDRSRLLLQQSGALIDASGQLPLSIADHVGIAAGDLDGDGVLDLAVASRRGGTILRGTIGGRFVTVPGRWPDTGERSCLLLVDADADGDLDLIVGSRLTSNHLYFNDGAGRFVGPSSADRRLPLQREGLYAVLDDFDADGDLDVIAPGVFWQNDGFGGFEVASSQAPRLGDVAFELVRPAVGDIDGDGHLDLIVASAWDRFRVYHGHGGGAFTAGDEYRAPLEEPSAPWELRQSIAVTAVCDLDHDGDLDLLCGVSPVSAQQPSAPARDSVWRNDGSGRLIEDPSALPAGASFGRDVAFGDFDGDGRVDFTDGRGCFVQRPDRRFEWVAPDPSGAQFFGWIGSVAVADLDGDGALDVVLGNGCLGTPFCEGDHNYVAWNDGTGVLLPAPLSAQQSDEETRAVAVLDVNGDERLDVFFGDVDLGSHGDGLDELWIHVGGRRFEDGSAQLSRVWRDTWDVLAGDLDADGDVDLLTLDAPITSLPAERDLRGTIWWNRSRQLVAPDLLRVGREYRLELHGAIAGGALLASAFAASVPVPPFGVLGVDPSAIAWLATFAGPTTSRLAEFALRVPVHSSLVGAEFVFQGIVVDAHGELRLTNRIVERFLAD